MFFPPRNSSFSRVQRPANQSQQMTPIEPQNAIEADVSRLLVQDMYSCVQSLNSLVCFSSKSIHKLRTRPLSDNNLSEKSSLTLESGELLERTPRRIHALREYSGSCGRSILRCFDVACFDSRCSLLVSLLNRYEKKIRIFSMIINLEFRFKKFYRIQGVLPGIYSKNEFF